MQNSRGRRFATPADTPLNPRASNDDVGTRRRKTRMLHIRVTVEEEDRIHRAADAMSLRLASYCRFACLHLAGAPTREEYDALGIDALVDRLERVGNNLNQLARAANRGGIVMSNSDRLVLLEVKDELEAARTLFLAWREAVKTRTARLDIPDKSERRKHTS